MSILEFYFLIRPSDRRGIELARYRNMRSKRRCSLCLQFALILGAGPVLHRPTSLVIHRLEWNLFKDSIFFLLRITLKRTLKNLFRFTLFGFRAVTRTGEGPERNDFRPIICQATNHAGNSLNLSIPVICICGGTRIHASNEFCFIQPDVRCTSLELDRYPKKNWSEEQASRLCVSVKKLLDPNPDRLSFL